MKEKYRVGGMSCAACSARVERAVSAIEGVEVCSVNLLTGEMLVEGEVSASTVVGAVTEAGYTAELAVESTGEDELADKESPRLLSRLIWSLGFVIVLMYFSMGHMLGLPLPSVLKENPLAVAIIQMLLAAVVMVINRKFFINGVKGVIHLAPNMDTLVSLGSLASFGYSLYLVVVMAIEVSSGGTGGEHLHGLYFESAAMILALITLGKLLEARAKGKTTSALRALLELRPKTATVIRDGKECTVSVDEVKVGDVFVVRAGERIPTDGIVLSGDGAIDESALSGESMPIDKSEGARVFGATVSRSGYLECRATEVGEGTAIAGIIRMVKEASSTKAPIAKLADRVSGVFVPIVMTIAVVTLFGWLIAGEGIGFAVARGVSVLVISCPCALGLATPVAIMVASGVGARRGILFKSAAAIEEMGRVGTVVLDKTGTVTLGEMSVSSVVSEDEERLLSLAYSLEYMSEHPLGAAVVRYGDERGVKKQEITDFETLPGRGVSGKLEGREVFGVSFEYAKTLTNIDKKAEESYNSLAGSGKTPIVFVDGGKYMGMIGISDTLKPDAKDGVVALRELGLRVIMLTGDNEISARAVARSVGIDEVVAGVLPGGKESVIRELGRAGKVAMVGDGINDAPALTRADVGIAVGCGTDVAIESADVVLVRDRINDIATAVGIGRAALMNIRENLGWAFVYNMIGIPMAMGVLGLTLDPMFGALAMSLSSFSVVMNALRLNLWRPRHERKKNKIRKENTRKEERKMKRLMKVEGMMCPHCEARVKKVLEAIEGVAEAVPSHKSGTVEVTLSGAVADSALTAAVTDAGYEVKGIE